SNRFYFFNRLTDRSALILDVMHRPLEVAVPHEFPAGFQPRLRHARIALADRAIDGERRLQVEFIQDLQKTPKPDPHPIFMPGPVRQIGQDRLAVGRRQHGARHRPLDRPFLDVDDGPDGDAPILEAVNAQKADFLLLDVGEVADAYKGQGDWKGKPMPNLRTAITLYGSQMAFWVKKDSGIDSIAALKGKRVPSEWVQQTGVLPHTTALLNAGGITYNDVVKVPEVNVVRAADDFKAGKLDLLFFAVGAPKVAEVAAAVGGLRLLPADKLPDAERRMKKVRTEYYFSRVSPAPNIAGVDKPS